MAMWMGCCKWAPLAVLLIGCALLAEAPPNGLAEVPPAAAAPLRTVVPLPGGGRHEVAVGAIGTGRADLAAPQVADLQVPYVVSQPSPRVDPFADLEPVDLGRMEPAAPMPELVPAFGVQLMALSDATTARASLERVRGQLAAGAVEQLVVMPPPEGGRWYRLVGGPYEDRASARAACRALAAVSPDCFVVEGFGPQR